MTDLPKPGDIDAMEALIRPMLPSDARIAGYDDGPTDSGFGKTAVNVECRGRKCLVSVYSDASGWEASVIWSTDTSWFQPIETAQDLRDLIA